MTNQKTILVQLITDLYKICSKQYDTGNKDIMDSNLNFPIVKQNLPTRDLVYSLVYNNN